MIIYWEKIKPNSKRVLFNKKIFGYRQEKKHYEGILQKYNGKKIGKGSIIAPSEAQNELNAILKKLKINAKIIKVLEYE